MIDDKIFFIAFDHLINFTFRRYKLLIKSFNTLKSAFNAQVDDFISIGFSSNFSIKLKNDIKNIDLDKIIKKITQENIEVCVFSDDNYPSLLKNIYSPPPIIYYQGDLNINWNLSLSVVGSRILSFYGERNINNFISLLPSYNINVVSGLALGSDSLAHQVILKNKGVTVAVLGSGIDNYSIYPQKNLMLARKIVDSGGLIMSEFSPGTKPYYYHFPQRNRIISGLSMATIVVEAGQRSGSLITAKYAIEEGRDVLTFPGDINSDNYQGNNNLIKFGAGVITNISDILQIFNIDFIVNENKQNNKKYISKNEIEDRIINILRNNPVNMDFLEKNLSYDIAILGATLSLLEIRGVIKDIGGKNYILCKK